MKEPTPCTKEHAQPSPPKVSLSFMVAPEQLATRAYVPDGVRCQVTDLDKMRERKLFGDSGLRMAAAGFTFIFTRDLAEQLLSDQVVRAI
jgi:hypothetical protein